MGYGKCFLSGRFGYVERHHIFGGPLRSKSERYGLVVELSPWTHREGPNSAHRSGETAKKLKRYGQMKCMVEQGWDLETWIREFGKNYLFEDDLDVVKLLQAEGEDKPLTEEEIEQEEQSEVEGLREWLNKSIWTTKENGVAWTKDEPEKVTVRGQGFRVTVEVMPF